MSGDVFIGALAVVGVVIVISTLLSGVIDRWAVPQVAVFLLLGAALGPYGVDVFGTPLDSPILRVVSTLSLTLVLFTDAITLDMKEVRRHAGLALRMLGPGTLASAALIGLAGWWWLGLSPAGAAILGAALASTDPVLLRGLLRRKDIPVEARLALRLESGLNDVVLLPIVIVAMPLLAQAGAAPWGRMAMNLFVLGPLGGVAVGFVGVALLDRVRQRTGVRRDYESIYSLGVAFAAYAAAEAMHGSGFLAAFAAGMTIVWFDVELCDCFVEYGETTGEMLLLFTFVLLGSGPIWQGLAALDGRMAVFVLIALVVRPAVSFLSLLGTGMKGHSRLLISWFGPRGLSSLLLVLLPVFAGLPGAGRLFEACCLVVLASVVIHGGSLSLLTWRHPPGKPASAPVPAPAPTLAPAPDPDVEPSEPTVLMTLDELAALQARGEPVVIADVRTERSASESPDQAAGAVRLDPEDPVAAARRLGIPPDKWIALYCA